MKLFPSTLVVARSLDQIDGLLRELGHQGLANNPDLLLIDIYTIEAVRSITGFLSRKPILYESKIVVIPDADRLNLESQNCLLKNLEEPGEGNYFILTSARPNALLSTIISRCRIIRTAPSDEPSARQKLIFPDSINGCLTAASALPSDKSAFTTFLEEQIRLYQSQLVATPTSKTKNILQNLIKTQKLLDANVDPRSAADFLMLSALG